jgi:uncharacterized protein (DUF1800 family)
MIAQNRLLRDHAGGNFRALCKAITVDPAMLIWLDGNTNQKIQPNENYGREFLELFTLGRDRGYTQEDVRQSARAFTGYTTDGQGKALYHKELHDDGEKTILGNTGNWGVLDVADIVLDRHPEGPVAARYVAARLAGFLYKPDPEPEVTEAMAAAFLGANYDIKAMVKALLLSPQFMDGPGLTIKSPAEFVAGTMRLLKLTGTPAPSGEFRRNGFDEIVSACTDMGQELFEPPDVSGWKGGAVWANTAATLARYNFAARIGKLVTDNAVRTVLDSAGGEARDTAALWMQRLGLLSLLPSTEAALTSYLDASTAAKADPGVRTRGVLTLLLASPDFNLR